ncbi:MAG: 3-dehydroquinate synthase [Eubacterium sp.]|nr:3-dehydroquinate synthase [Eubacterium sp.]
MQYDSSKLVIKGRGEPGFSYPIVWEDSFSALSDEIRKVLGSFSGKLCIMTDSHVSELYLQPVTEALKSSYTLTKPFIFPAGEKHKQLSVLQEFYQHLLCSEMDRKDVIVALGGGVTGDMAGFAAATYRRGIRFIQIPTTLLAQVDSSIGGKTAVDLGSFKNMIGAFHQPLLVYMNPLVLQTLSGEQFSSGMGEVIKTALIGDEQLYTYLKMNAEAICRGEASALRHIVRACCAVKAAVVEEDPLDQGIRAVLNFGHTIGHAVEAESRFSLPHGHCVAIGMAAALRLCEKRGFLKPEERNEAAGLISRFGLPTAAEEWVSQEKLLSLCMSDKKVEEGKLRFILLNKIGSAFIEPNLEKDELIEAIRSISAG